MKKRISIFLLLALSFYLTWFQVDVKALVTTDTISPVLESWEPSDGSRDVLIDTEVRLNFSEPMDTTTTGETEFLISSNTGTSIQGTLDFFVSEGYLTRYWENSNETLVLNFAGSYKLNKNRKYTIELVNQSATDLAGNPLEVNETVSEFFTETDSNAPSLIGLGVGTDKETCETDISADNINQNLDITENPTPTFCVKFSENMKDDSLLSAVFLVENEVSSVSYEMSLSNFISHNFFNPLEYELISDQEIVYLKTLRSLDTSDTYSVKLLESEVQDLDGNMLRLDSYSGAPSSPVNTSGKISSSSSTSSKISVLGLSPVNNSHNVGLKQILQFSLSKPASVVNDICTSNLDLNAYKYDISGDFVLDTGSSRDDTISNLVESGVFSLYDLDSGNKTLISCSSTSSLTNFGLEPNTNIFNYDSKYQINFSGGGDLDDDQSLTLFTLAGSKAPKMIDFGLTEDMGTSLSQDLSNVALTTDASVYFSKEMNETTVNESIFKIEQLSCQDGSTASIQDTISNLVSDGQITTNWNDDFTVLTVNPVNDLKANCSYKVALTTNNAKSADGYTLDTLGVNSITFDTYQDTGTSLSIDSVSAESLDNYTAMVSWTTSETASSKVKYCETLDSANCLGDYKYTETDILEKKSHLIEINGLKKNTEYLVYPVSVSSFLGVSKTYDGTKVSFTTANEDKIIEGLSVVNDNPEKSNNSNYYFSFVTPSYLPKNGKILITLPSSYNFSGPVNVISSSFLNDLTLNTIEEVSTNKILVSLNENEDYQAYSFHTFALSGITNPNTKGTYTVYLQTQDNDGNIISDDGSDSVSVTDVALTDVVESTTSDITDLVTADEGILKENLAGLTEGITGTDVQVKLPQGFEATESDGSTSDLSSVDFVKSEAITADKFTDADTDTVDIVGKAVTVGDSDNGQNFSDSVEINFLVNLPAKPTDASELTDIFGGDFPYTFNQLTDDIYSRLFELVVYYPDTDLTEIVKKGLRNGERVKVILDKAGKLSVRKIKNPVILELDTSDTVEETKPTLMPNLGKLPKQVKLKNSTDNNLSVTLSKDTKITEGTSPFNGLIHPPKDVSTNVKNKKFVTDTVTNTSFRDASKFVSVGANGKSLSLDKDASLTITNLDTSKTYRVKYFDPATETWKDQAGATCTRGASSCTFLTDHFTVFMAEATGNISSSSGGGGGGGFYSVDTKTPYSLPKFESNSESEMFRPVSLDKTNGEFNRPIVLANNTQDHRIKIAKGVKVTNSEGEAYTGLIWYPKSLSVTERPNPPKNHQMIRTISAGSEEENIYFSKEIDLTIDLPAFENVDKNYLKVYKYNPITKKFSLIEGEKVSEDLSEITIKTDHLSIFSVLYSYRGENEKDLSSGDSNFTAPVSNTIKFRDISNHWAKSYINKLSANGIVKGRTKDKFVPNDFINRADFVTMIVRAFDYEVPEKVYENPFDDVDSSVWYAPYLQVAKAKNLIKGYTSYIDQVKIRKVQLNDTNTKEGIKNLQYILKELGYEVNINGEFDGLTSTALANYQLAKGFTYVSGSLGTDTIKNLNEEDFVKTGKIIKEDGKKVVFNPSAKINRVDSLKIILEAAKIDFKNYKSDFVDVPDNVWFTKYVTNAKANGIVSGKTKNIFMPAGFITRAETTKILVETLDY